MYSVSVVRALCLESEVLWDQIQHCYGFSQMYSNCCAVCLFLVNTYCMDYTYCRNDCLMVMLKYLNELSFYYLAAGTQENAQVTRRKCRHTYVHVFS